MLTGDITYCPSEKSKQNAEDTSRLRVSNSNAMSELAVSLILRTIPNSVGIQNEGLARQTNTYSNRSAKFWLLMGLSQEDHKFEACLGCNISSRSDWAI